MPGPCADLFQRGPKGVRHSAVYCEDLGIITSDVHALRDQFQLPGTKILQFAFDGNADNPYLPHNYVPKYGRLHRNPRQQHHSRLV